MAGPLAGSPPFDQEPNQDDQLGVFAVKHYGEDTSQVPAPVPQDAKRKHAFIAYLDRGLANELTRDLAGLWGGHHSGVGTVDWDDPGSCKRSRPSQLSPPHNPIHTNRSNKSGQSSHGFQGLQGFPQFQGRGDLEEVEAQEASMLIDEFAELLDVPLGPSDMDKVMCGPMGDIAGDDDDDGEASEAGVGLGTGTMHRESLTIITSTTMRTETSTATTKIGIKTSTRTTTKVVRASDGYGCRDLESVVDSQDSRGEASDYGNDDDGEADDEFQDFQAASACYVPSSPSAAAAGGGQAEEMDEDSEPDQCRPWYEERRCQRHQTAGSSWGTYLDFNASDFRDPAESFPGERARYRLLAAEEDFRILGDTDMTFQGQLFATTALERDVLPDRLLAAYLLLYPPTPSHPTAQGYKGQQHQQDFDQQGQLEDGQGQQEPQGPQAGGVKAGAEAEGEGAMEVEDSGYPAAQSKAREAAVALETTAAEPKAGASGLSATTFAACPLKPDKSTKVFRHRCIFCTEAAMTAAGASVRLEDELDTPVDLRGLVPRRDIREEGCAIS